MNSTINIHESVKNTEEYYGSTARCRDKGNLKNGKLKSTIGQTYEEGTELQFDCKVHLCKFPLLNGNLGFFEI